VSFSAHYIVMKSVCKILGGSIAQDPTTIILILGFNLVIATYNLAQLKRSRISNLAGRKAYVLLLLLPLFHASVSPWMFLEFYDTAIFILEPVLCCLNILGLAMYIKLVKLAAGGVLEIQESLELITYSDGYIKLRCYCVSCYGFGSLWFLFVFLNRATYLFFLQPIFMMFDTILKALHDKKFLNLSYMFLTLDIVTALIATFKMTRILRPLSSLTRTWLKMLYVFLVILFTQVQFSVIFTIIYAEHCDFESSFKGLTFLTSIEMVVVGLLGSISFPLSDLLTIRAEKVRDTHISLEREHIDFLF
jgi:hypothetical protein